MSLGIKVYTVVLVFSIAGIQFPVILFIEVVGRSGITAGSNSTRGIFAGGVTPSYTNTIEFITMSTEGNGTDFGDLIGQVAYTGAGMYSATRGVHAGGYPSTNVIQFITIASAANAQDFGDLILKRVSYAGSSDSHGGLG